MNIKLTLSYDGTNYHGWQSQPNARTIQGTLIPALQRIMPYVENIQGVSRTDTGVHALFFVANFHTEKPIPLANLPRALNSLLPPDIRIFTAEQAPDDFNSRFDCTSKTYIYRINNSAIQSPFDRNYSWHFPYPIDIEKMQSASKHLLGTHDFSAFCSAHEQRPNHTRTINSIEITKNNTHPVGAEYLPTAKLSTQSQLADNIRPYNPHPPHYQPSTISFQLNANGFLYNMVRIIVGTLVEIGSNRIPADSLPSILADLDRKKAGRTAPANGLFLQEIFF